ncbi:MAG: thioredoxin fold domain-containing protein [Bacteroidetes bacterium]|nr:thioredoxin fold domain-containing protein [Bacteroidota bacterium]
MSKTHLKVFINPRSGTQPQNSGIRVKFTIGAILLILGVMFLSLNAFNSQSESDVNPAQGIQFRHIGIEEALKLAKYEKKIIFVDAYADWCGPCKRLARTTFMDTGVASLFNNTFVNVKMNVDQSWGKSFSHSYGIQSLPTLLFIDTSGNVLQRTVGTIDAERLVSLAMSLKK